jgi:hypothetical protein
MTRTLLAACCAAALALPTCASADPFDERFTFSIDRFRSDFDTDVRVDSVEFSFEQDLGLDRRDDINAFEATWRFAERHALTAAAFHGERTNTVTLSERIIFGDDIYDVNVRARARFSAKVAELLYRYAFVRNERVRAEAMIGVHKLDLGASIGIVASANDGEVSAEARARVKADAPLPVIGAALSVAITPTFFFDVEGQALSASVNDIDGTITDWRAGVRWHVFDHFETALYYNRFDMHLDLERSAWTGSLDFGYRGPQLVGTLRF